MKTFLRIIYVLERITSLLLSMALTALAVLGVVLMINIKLEVDGINNTLGRVVNDIIYLMNKK